LDVEAQVRDAIEILHEHVSIAGQPEHSTIVLNLVVNVAAELNQILPVQTIGVRPVEIRKRRSGHGELSLDRRSAPENITEGRDRRDRVVSCRWPSKADMAVLTREAVHQYYLPLWLWHRLDAERWKGSSLSLRESKRESLSLDVDHIVHGLIFRFAEVRTGNPRRHR
jgi:hypothetical protein